MISVVIPLYNKAGQVARTLRSVLEQTFDRFEVVIVDDGSTDGSADEACSVHDNRIRIVRQRNAGVSAARNRGIAEARYDLIAFLDADDEWKPTYLETQCNLYRKYPDCSVFACNYEFRNADGRVTPTILRRLPFAGEDGILSNYFEVASCSHPPLWTSAVMVRKQAVQAVGGFPVGVRSGEDLLTWARLAVAGKIAFSNRVEAVFILDPSHNVNKKPSRPHDKIDLVGINLEQLLLKIDRSRYRDLKMYISLWYKMRTSVSLRMYDATNTWKYGLKSLSYNWLNWKVYMMLVMVLIPKFIQRIIKNKYVKTH